METSCKKPEAKIFTWWIVADVRVHMSKLVKSTLYLGGERHRGACILSWHEAFLVVAMCFPTLCIMLTLSLKLWVDGDIEFYYLRLMYIVMTMYSFYRVRVCTGACVVSCAEAFMVVPMCFPTLCIMLTLSLKPWVDGDIEFHYLRLMYIVMTMYSFIG